MRLVAGIIPCRWGSTRFPGKPLAEINGKPMMWHVYQRAMECKSLDAVFIATEDERIASRCRDLSMKVVMTRTDHATGTDRVAEVAERHIGAHVYVNIQGDEPMIEPAAISAVASAIELAGDVSNGWARFSETSDIVDVNNVKAVIGADDNALYFSRLPIPYPKGGRVDYRRQLGLYAFGSEALAFFARTPPGPLEMAEGVEMLRFVEQGRLVRMVEVEDRSIPVDTPADLERVRAMMAPKAAAA